ncbi:MAG TPA: dockerin type I domain-containing protein [Phycisphaerae bacterium]|nr:dockerin type I domain-containing protein [Phycisphaerae bacterium]
MKRFLQNTASVLVLASILVGQSGARLEAQAPSWKIVKPSMTGVPGDEVRVMKFDAEGNLWIVSRMIDWWEVAVAMLPASELPYTPLSGGGFDTGAWTVWSSVEHPIPSVFIHDLEFGAGGVIWLTSDAGLTRFDPNGATPQQMWFTYNTSNSPLVLNGVRSIDTDSQGNLWLTNVTVSNSNGALFKFNPAANQWTKFEVGQQLPWYTPWRDVNSVLVGADDRVWLTHSTLGGMAEFNGTSWVLHACPYPMGDMLEDLQGNIWITTGEFGLWKWNGTGYQVFDLGSQGTVMCLGMNSDTGLVYAGAWYGDIYQMVNGNSPQFFVNADNIPGSIHVRPNGDIWINNYGGNGTLGTVRHYKEGGELLERFNTFNSGLPDYFIDRIQSDSSGNVWFASGEGGLSRMTGNDAYAPARWRNWGNHNDLSEPYPWAGSEPMYEMLEASDGKIWMAGNGVGRWDPETGTFTGFWNTQNSNLSPMICTGITQDGDGTIWAGDRYVGVWELDTEINDWVLHTWAPSGWTANDVIDVATDTEGALWVLTYIQLHRRNANGTWSTWDVSNSPLPLDGTLFNLEPDPTNGVWVGIQGRLLHFDGTNWTTITQAQAGWPGTNVNGIAFRSSDGKLAVTTQQPSVWPYTGGISVRNDNGTWTHYTTANSPLTHWQVSAPHFDAGGHLWASAMSEGVVQILIGLKPGDIDGDGFVNLIDANLFVGALLGTNTLAPQINRSDLNGDGEANGADTQLFVDLLLAP